MCIETLGVSSAVKIVMYECTYCKQLIWGGGGETEMHRSLKIHFKFFFTLLWFYGVPVAKKIQGMLGVFL